MTTDSGFFWPYLLLAICWSAACGWLLLRVRKAPGPIALVTPVATIDTGSDSVVQAHSPQWERDTQAGRM